MKIKELLEQFTPGSNFLSDVIQAQDLVNRATHTDQYKKQYRQFMNHLKNKHGPDYAIRVHRKAQEFRNYNRDNIKESWELVPNTMFKEWDPDDEYLYHVTSEPNAKKILSQGFSKRSKPMFTGGGYKEYSRDKIFFTDRSGVGFWMSRVEDYLFHHSDDPPEVAVIRIPRSQIKDQLKQDELGTRDSRHPAWYIEKKSGDTL